MAVKLEFTSIIVPVKTIIEKCGMEHFLRRYGSVLDPEWRDEHLFREGAMNPLDIDDMLTSWEEKGLQSIEILDGQKHWKDLCLIDYYEGPSHPCTWLSFDSKDHCVWLSEKPKGKVVGPQNREVFSAPVILDF